jgi:hypothetical protein
MPIYAGICSKCGAKQDYYRTISLRNETPQCCGEPITRVIEAPMVGSMSFSGTHKSVEINGIQFDNGAQIKKYMKENNFIPETEATSEAKYQQKEKEKADNKHLKQSVLQAVAMHS